MVAKPEIKRIWGQTAGPADIEDPDITLPGKFSSGWVSEIPPYQFFNYLQNLVTAGLAHINERGIAEWDATTNYLAGRSYVTGSNGVLYKAITNNTNKNPLTNPSDWEVYPAASGAASTVAAGIIRIANSVEIQTGTSDTLAVSPAGLVSRVATTAKSGILPLATQLEVNAGTDPNKAVTPITLQGKVASTSALGLTTYALAGDVAVTNPAPPTNKSITPASLVTALSTYTPSTTRPGLLELATDVEAQNQADNQRAITPSNLAAVVATETRRGLSELATPLEAIAGTDLSRVITPATLFAALATVPGLSGITTSGNNTAGALILPSTVVGQTSDKRFCIQWTVGPATNSGTFQTLNWHITGFDVLGQPIVSTRSTGPAVNSSFLLQSYNSSQVFLTYAGTSTAILTNAVVFAIGYITPP